MKNKRDIYCEYAFWEAFFEMEEKVLHDRSKRKLWDAFYEFLSINNLFFDVPNQSVTEDTCGGKNLMLLRQEKGGAGIKFIPKKFPHINDLSDVDDNILNAIFLTVADTSECKNLSDRFGVIVFNLSMIFSADHMYIDNGQSFDRSNGQNWTYLYDLKKKCPSVSCCNSIVIADRYLLSNLNECAFNNNLKPIFDALLPQSLDNGIVFNICIIAENICRSIEDKLHRIEILVENIRPKLSFSVNIFHSKKMHDRSILTNNIILTSGAGFNVIGPDEIPLKFTTTSLFFPFFKSDSNGRILYLDWINNVLKVERSCRFYQHNYWGEEKPKNHLLDFYYEEPAMPRATCSLGNAFAGILLKARATM